MKHPAAEHAAPNALPYPNGWFSVAFSDQVARGKVFCSRLMSEDVVLYRTRGGTLRAVRPYCPHLGAHLGFGGHVDGEYLVCPFHNFAYDTDGTCVRTGHGAAPKASLTQLNSCERDGIIWVWHHSGGQEPIWTLPEHDATDWPRRSWKTLRFTGYAQDVTENGFDLRHLLYLHGYEVTGAAGPLRFSGPTCERTVLLRKKFPGLGWLEFENHLTTWGLGYNRADVRVPRFHACLCLWAAPTPIGPRAVEVRFSAGARVPEQPLSNPVLRTVAHAASILATPVVSRITATDVVRNDFPIWTTKTYIDRPRLSQGDDHLGPYRKWAEQFYDITEPV